MSERAKQDCETLKELKMFDSFRTIQHLYLVYKVPDKDSAALCAVSVRFFIATTNKLLEFG